VDSAGGSITDDLRKKRVAQIRGSDRKSTWNERAELNELRRGGKAAIIARPGFRNRAVLIAGHRSLSAEMISAMSDAAAAASATKETAMLTSVSFSS